MLDASPEVKQMSIIYTNIVVYASLGCFLEVNLEKNTAGNGQYDLSDAVPTRRCGHEYYFGPDFYLRLPRPAGNGNHGRGNRDRDRNCIDDFRDYYFFTKSHDVHITFKKFKINWTTIKDIYIVGVPSIVMQAIGSVLTTALNWILIGFSEAAVSVFGIYFKLQSFIFMPVFGLTHGVMPIMGYSFGARNKSGYCPH